MTLYDSENEYEETPLLQHLSMLGAQLDDIKAQIENVERLVGNVESQFDAISNELNAQKEILGDGIDKITEKFFDIETEVRTKLDDIHGELTAQTEELRLPVFIGTNVTDRLDDLTTASNRLLVLGIGVLILITLLLIGLGILILISL